MQDLYPLQKAKKIKKQRKGLGTDYLQLLDRAGKFLLGLQGDGYGFTSLCISYTCMGPAWRSTGVLCMYLHTF